jgi:hypothetical protein
MESQPTYTREAVEALLDTITGLQKALAEAQERLRSQELAA